MDPEQSLIPTQQIQVEIAIRIGRTRMSVADLARELPADADALERLLGAGGLALGGEHDGLRQARDDVDAFERGDRPDLLAHQGDEFVDDLDLVRAVAAQAVRSPASSSHSSLPS